MKNTMIIDCPLCRGTGKIETSNKKEMFGYRLKAIRERKDLTQGEVARLMGLTRTSITNIEAGRQNLPMHKVYQLADVLRVDVKELF